MVIVPDDFDHRRHFVPLEPFLAKPADAPAQQFRILRAERRDFRGDDLSSDRTVFAAHGHVFDIIELQQDVFDLGGVNFLATDVDQLRPAAENAQVFAVNFDEILRVEPPVGIERRGCVQVAEHRRLRSDP